jgi:undecaprenyl-diphosphatase
LLCGALASLLVFITLTTAVHQPEIDAVDTFVRSLVRPAANPLLDVFMETASYLAGHPGQIVAIVFASAVLWWRRHWRWGVALPIVMAGAGALQLAAKWAVDRPRPNLDAGGFPSAHVLMVVVLAGYLTYVVATLSTRPRSRALAVAACILVVGLVAFSRMYLDAHWLSGVLGGASIGVAYLLTAIWVIQCAPVLARPPGRRSSPTTMNGSRPGRSARLRVVRLSR